MSMNFKDITMKKISVQQLNTFMKDRDMPLATRDALIKLFQVSDTTRQQDIAARLLTVDQQVQSKIIH